MGRLAGMNWRDGWRCFLMDEEIERLVVSVRADTQGFASDVAAMREELDGPLGDSVGRAGALIENALSRAVRRSEEHTSELQSLMRISYAVFCLKKKIHSCTDDSTYQKHQRSV